MNISLIEHCRIWLVVICLCLCLFMLNIETSTRGTNSMPFLVFQRDHLRSTSGIICGSGSFAVHCGDHFRSRDHLWSGIICGAVYIVTVDIHVASGSQHAVDPGNYHYQLPVSPSLISVAQLNPRSSSSGNRGQATTT